MKVFVPYKLQIVFTWFRVFLIGTTVKLCQLIGLKRSLYIFNAKHGYLDNAKYLFEYYVKQGELCIWVANTKSSADSVREAFADCENVKIKRKNSILLAYYLCKAKYLFITHNYGDIGRYPKCVKVINLWHGVALKKMGFDSPNDMKELAKLDKNPYLSNDNLISTSSLTAKHLASAMRLPISTVLPLGQPRNDIFSRDNLFKEKEVRNSYLTDNFERNSTKIYLYAPTFRDKPINPLPIYLQVINTFEANKDKNNLLVLRLHPNERSILDKFNLSERVVMSHCIDVQHDLLAADVLISDYSSVIFDYMLTGKPIILFCPDKEIYFNNRGGFYFDYDEVFNTCYQCHDQSALQGLLDNDLLRNDTCNTSHQNACHKIYRHFS